jgi:hypothetical protein
MKKDAGFHIDWESLAKGFALGGLGGLGWMGANKLGSAALEKIFYPNTNDDIIVYYDPEKTEEEDEDKAINYKYASAGDIAGWIRKRKPGKGWLETLWSYVPSVSTEMLRKSLVHPEYGFLSGSSPAPAPAPAPALAPAPPSSPMGSGFWTAIGAVPGVYAAIKGVQALEGIAQEKEFRRAIQDIEQDINKGEKKDQEKQAFEKKIYKFAVLKEYISSFNKELEKEAAASPEFKIKLGKLYKSQEKMFRTVLHDAQIEKQAFEKQAGGTWWPPAMEVPWQVAKNILGQYGPLMGALVPIGFLSGHHMAKFYWPIEEKKTPPRILFKEKKKKKKKGLEKKSIDTSTITAMTQLLGAGYLVDLVRRTMGDSIAKQLSHQLYPNQDPFRLKQVEEKKKPTKLSGLPDLGKQDTMAGPGQFVRVDELEQFGRSGK